jgi:hypothetical protein
LAIVVRSIGKDSLYRQPSPQAAGLLRFPKSRPPPVYPSSDMAPNRRSQELERAAALGRRKRRRRALTRDAVLALVIALILFGGWKIALAFAS